MKSCNWRHRLHKQPAGLRWVLRPEREVRLAGWAIWCIPLLWSVNYLVARRAPGVIDPYLLALLRWGIAGGLLGIFARKELVRHRRGILAAWHQYLALGFFGMVVCGAWVYVGARTTTAVNIALIYSASPVLIVVASSLWLHDRMRAVQWCGVALALVGVLHVIAKGQWLSLTSVQFVEGDAWIVAAMVSWALYALLQKVWPSDLSATARLAAICGGGVVILLPCALWEAQLAGAAPWSAQAAVLAIAAALFPGLAAYWVYGWAQRMLGANRVAMTLYLGPLYGALVAYAVLGEPLGWHHVAGAALILPGVYLVNRQPATT